MAVFQYLTVGIFFFLIAGFWVSNPMAVRQRELLRGIRRRVWKVV
jgi:hypothetical protein